MLYPHLTHRPKPGTVCTDTILYHSTVLTRRRTVTHREESMTYDAGMGVIKEEANDLLPED